jgi:holo-[acyl-carrier protein] synthase
VIIGVGVDVIEIGRIEKVLAQRGEKFTSKMYTETEVEYCNRHRASAAHFAGRFAAKEAAMKALGVGWGRNAGWRDIEVTNDERGKPHLGMTGSAAETAQGLGVKRTYVSLSHSRGTACAVVIMES